MHRFGGRLGPVIRMREDRLLERRSQLEIRAETKPHDQDLINEILRTDFELQKIRARTKSIA